ncbi:TPA: hypothetical protein DEP96_02060 [Candidatus Uhrbacteria bacterium]|nr:hypothetical protein [Candidatus Uhrbacteria bacterium]
MNERAPQPPHSPEIAKNKVEVQELDWSPEAQELVRGRVEQLINQVVDQNIGVIIFLDKSARPLSWLFRDLWQRQVPNQPLPIIRYLNIGRGADEQSSARGGFAVPSTSVMMNREPAKLRQLETKVKTAAEGAGLLDVDDLPSEWQATISEQTESLEILNQRLGHDIFDREKVLVVDDLTDTGQSLLTAMSAIKSAFPQTAKVLGRGIFSFHEIKQLGFQDDTDLLPWLHSEGWTGVHEYGAKTSFASTSHQGTRAALTEQGNKMQQASLAKAELIAKRLVDGQISAADLPHVTEVLGFAAKQYDDASALLDSETFAARHKTLRQQISALAQTKHDKVANNKAA